MSVNKGTFLNTYSYTEWSRKRKAESSLTHWPSQLNLHNVTIINTHAKLSGRKKKTASIYYQHNMFSLIFSADPGKQGQL